MKRGFLGGKKDSVFLRTPSASRSCLSLLGNKREKVEATVIGALGRFGG